jgi:hypothetical protein
MKKYYVRFKCSLCNTEVNFKLSESFPFADKFHQCIGGCDGILKAISFKEIEKEIDPGDGYRILEKGEISRKSDEMYLGDNEWEKFNIDGVIVNGGIYRRKKQYILLNKGEKIQEGDEFYLDNKEWRKSTCIGFTVKEVDFIYRREIRL